MNDSTDDSLYDIPIETLGIPAKTIQLLKRVGIESVGDCLYFHNLGGDVMIQVPYGLIDEFETQVLPRLREHGYLSSAEDVD